MNGHLEVELDTPQETETDLTNRVSLHKKPCVPAPQVHIIASSRAGFRQVLWLSTDAFGGLTLFHGEASLSERAHLTATTVLVSPHVSTIQTGIRMGGTPPNAALERRHRADRDAPHVVTLPAACETPASTSGEGPEQIDAVNKLKGGLRLTFRAREKTLVSVRLDTQDRLVVRRSETGGPWTARLHPSGVRSSGDPRTEPEVSIWLEL